MNTFIKSLEEELNVTQTTNGDKAYKSTLDKCLDLFGQVGACRDNRRLAKKLFNLAFKEDPETAVRALFWVRDIRGGQGERDVFKTLLKDLAYLDADLTAKLIAYVPMYGRWDDLFILEDTSLWNNVLDLILLQLSKDFEAISRKEEISLLGKWLPSINASSKNSKRLGRKIASHLKYSEKEYRKTLSFLRSYIKIVEQKMCAREWSSIEYSKVPSRASFMYRKAFLKRDEERYNEYLEAVSKGEAQINAATLYPYDIVNDYLYNNQQSNKTMEALWKALPNYMEGKKFNGLVVADVSGSMIGTPMAVSISLAMYISERNNNEIWKDKFITFSQNPTLETIVGESIQGRIVNLAQSEWGYNTDLMKVFRSILNAANKHEVKPEDMPEKLLIVSDMQFDQACTSGTMSSLEAAKELYDKSGYKLPDLVFWNVKASATSVPMTVNDRGVCLVSGYSPSILESVLTGDITTPIDIMNKTLYNERYNFLSSYF